MSKRETLIALGITIAVLLFLGFPSAWDKIFAVIIGLAVAFIAYRLPYTNKSDSKGGSHSYSDHRAVPPAGSAHITSPQENT